MDGQEFRGDDFFEGYNEGFNEGFAEARKFYLEMVKELLTKVETSDIGDVN